MNILFVPDPMALVLIADGPHGIRPPIVSRCSCQVWGCNNGCAMIQHRPLALILAWEGQIVPEGMNRAMQVLGALEELPDTWGLGFGRALGCWALGSAAGTTFSYYAATGKGAVMRRLNTVHDVEALTGESTTWEKVGAPLMPAWALAQVCQARGLGTMA
jgi:hypothetical protein